jgi:hypothetical protein
MENQQFEIREQMADMTKAQGHPQQNLRSKMVQSQQVITDANGNVINTRQTRAPGT